MGVRHARRKRLPHARRFLGGCRRVHRRPQGHPREPDRREVRQQAEVGRVRGQAVEGLGFQHARRVCDRVRPADHIAIRTRQCREDAVRHHDPAGVLRFDEPVERRPRPGERSHRRHRSSRLRRLAWQRNARRLRSEFRDLCHRDGRRLVTRRTKIAVVHRDRDGRRGQYRRFRPRARIARATDPPAHRVAGARHQLPAVEQRPSPGQIHRYQGLRQVRIPRFLEGQVRQHCRPQRRLGRSVYVLGLRRGMAFGQRLSR